MARYRRKDALEVRLTESLECSGRTWSADLIAKRATGVAGWRMTVAFLEAGGRGSVFVELPPATSREEATERAEGLRGDGDALAAMLAGRIAEG